MKPESEVLLAKGREFLAKSESMLAAGWPDEAGRTAYLAAFQAARAFIFERAARTVKTHAGVQTEWNRLARDEARIGLDLRGFLSRAYDLKAVADYGIDPTVRITAEKAHTAMSGAQAFVAAVEAVLNADGPDQLSNSESQ